jgi:anaphase-promoting complex subunit 13
MSVTLHYSLTLEPTLLDIVDEEWQRDTLPDDDIPLPEGVVPPLDESDDIHEELEILTKDLEKWTELGLHTVH